MRAASMRRNEGRASSGAIDFGRRTAMPCSCSGVSVWLLMSMVTVALFQRSSGREMTVVDGRGDVRLEPAQPASRRLSECNRGAALCRSLLDRGVPTCLQPEVWDSKAPPASVAKPFAPRHSQVRREKRFFIFGSLTFDIYYSQRNTFAEVPCRLRIRPPAPRRRQVRRPSLAFPDPLEQRHRRRSRTARAKP